MFLARGCPSGLALPVTVKDTHAQYHIVHDPILQNRNATTVLPRVTCGTPIRVQGHISQVFSSLCYSSRLGRTRCSGFVPHDVDASNSGIESVLSIHPRVGHPFVESAPP